LADRLTGEASQIMETSLSEASSLSVDAQCSTAPHIVLVAGETSGDNLGAELIEALRERVPAARFSGIAGPKMRAAGCDAWERAENLAVMGLAEVLPELPRLLRIRRDLIARVLTEKPAVYVGVDFKEFNLSVAKRLKRHGIRTVQYVSPQVWAWRQGRVRKIAGAVDAVLCLLPFEKDFYDRHAPKDSIVARFVGHPLADRIPLESDRAAARDALGVPLNSVCIGLLPGSRRGEVTRLAPDFAATVAWLLHNRPEMQFVAAMANSQAREIFATALDKEGVRKHVVLVDSGSIDVLAACDAALLASGTATLEATLVKRPMVVVYRLDALSTFLLRDLGFMKAPYFAQPNLLAGRLLVPEYFNAEVRAEVLGPALLQQLERGDREELLSSFAAIHRSLRRNASHEAARAVLDLIESTA
jgi:lipid-A-disaccharide synthase